MSYGCTAYNACLACTHYYIVLNEAYWNLSLTFNNLICNFTNVPASCFIAGHQICKLLMCIPS